MAAAAIATTCALSHVARFDRRALVLTLAAVALLAWLPVRHSTWLAAVNLSVAVALVLTAVTAQGHGTVLAAPRQIIRRWFRGVAASRFGPRVVGQVIADRLQRSPVDRTQAVTALRHVAVAGGVAAVVGVLLASGDALFASYLNVGSALSSGFERGAVGVLGSLVFVAGVGSSHAHPSPSLEPWRVRTGLASTIVATLAVVIGLFGIVQIVAVTSGAAHVEQRTGLTYAEWARSGFFQVVAVVALSVAALLTARVSMPAERSTSLLASGAALTLGVLGLVATSIAKLVVYTDQFGLTMLRLYTITFSVWMALVSVASLVALAGSQDRWFRPAVLTSIVVGCFAMNAANPERFVAEHNIERARGGTELDLAYLYRLSADATPTVLAFLSENDIEGAHHLANWCDDGTSSTGVFDFNHAVEAAARARAAFCVEQ